jgi:hypothetical protein
MGRPKIVYRSPACMQSEGRFFTVGKSFIAVEDLIAVGFQPIVKGRAKIMRGVDNRIKLYSGYKFVWRMVIRSREVACSR